LRKNLVKNLSFALFDSGETILGALIFSTFFPLYITQHIDTKIYSFVYGISFIFSFIFALFLGKIADEKRLRKPFYILFILLTGFLCISIGIFEQFPIIALFLFSLMAISHQQAFVFYNSMLLDFEKKGFISGLGVAFGYIGSAIALIFLARVLHIPDVFYITALIFLILSFPSMVFLENPQPSKKVSIKEVFKDRRFLLVILSILSLTEVANTLLAMMSIYLKKVYGFEDVYIYKIIGFSAIGGILGGIVWGKLVDIFSAKKLFTFGFFLWIGFLIFLPLAPAKIILTVGFLAGFSLAHLWTVSRVVILEEFPQEEASLRFSFLSLSERIASTTGLLTWTALLFFTGDNFRLSALLMVIFPVLGLALYWKVKSN